MRECTARGTLVQLCGQEGTLSQQAMRTAPPSPQGPAKSGSVLRRSGRPRGQAASSPARRPEPRKEAGLGRARRAEEANRSPDSKHSLEKL